VLQQCEWLIDWLIVSLMFPTSRLWHSQCVYTKFRSSCYPRILLGSAPERSSCLAYWPICSLPLRQVRLASFCPRALSTQGPPRRVIPLLPPPFPIQFYIFSRLCFLCVQKRFSKKKNKKKEKTKRKEKETLRRPSSPAPAMLLSHARIFASTRLSPLNPLLPSYFTTPRLVYPASLLTRLQPFASLSTSIYFFILSFFFFFFFSVV
jgi:hypothetical protein